MQAMEQKKTNDSRATAVMFEQQPRESDKAFAAFSLYLSLRSERSAREVGKWLGKSEEMIQRWAAKFDWR